MNKVGFEEDKQGMNEMKLIILEKVGMIVSNAAKEIAVRESFDKGAYAGSITYKVEPEEEVVRIGSNLQQAVFCEFGTGQRGSEGFQKYFNEDKPAFTIPIKPKNARALHWVDKSGKDVFVKSTKGMRPTAALRRALFNSKGEIENLTHQ